MTLKELRAIVEARLSPVKTLRAAMCDLETFIEGVAVEITRAGYSEIIDVDAYVALMTPEYEAHLATIAAAAAALGIGN